MSKDMKINEATPDRKESNGAGGNENERRRKTVFLAVTAVLLLVFFANNIFARTSNEGGGWLLGGSCCGSGSGSFTREQLARAGVEYYHANFGEDDVEAVVEDYGCHQEIVIYRDGKPVRRLSFAYGKIYDITP